MKKPANRVWYVYMILAESEMLYTGITTDIQKRFAQHASGKGGAKFFRSTRPLEVVWKKRCLGRSKASKLEAEIKAMPRKEKWKLAFSKP